MYVVVSYASDGEDGWYACGHYNLEKRWGSQFAVKAFPCTAELSAFVASVIHGEPLADHLHLVLTDWDSLVDLGKQWVLPPPSNDELSVHVLDWRLSGLQDDIRIMVKAEVERLDKQQREEELARESAEAERKSRENEAGERALYEKLKLKFGGK